MSGAQILHPPPVRSHVAPWIRPLRAARTHHTFLTALRRLLRGRRVLLNLIPYNQTAAGDAHGYKSPSEEHVRRFAKALTASSISSSRKGSAEGSNAESGGDEGSGEDGGEGSNAEGGGEGGSESGGGADADADADKDGGVGGIGGHFEHFGGRDAPLDDGSAPLRVSVRWSSAYTRDVSGACGQLALVTAPPDIEDLAPNTKGETVPVLLPPSTAPPPLAPPPLPLAPLPSLLTRVVSRSWGWLSRSDSEAEAAPLPTGAALAPAEAFASDAASAAASDVVSAIVAAAGEADAIASLPPLQQLLLGDGVPFPLLPLYESPTTFAFDAGLVARFVTPLRRAFGGSALASGLAALDATPPKSPCVPALQHALLCSGHALPAADKRAGAALWMKSAERRDFLVAYEDFVRTVILPRVDVGPHLCGRLVYQAEPTLRVSLPGGRAPGGRPRAASELYHQPGELSFWVPLTEVVGSSAAMHVAAVAGAQADVAPLRSLIPGECASWYAHRLRSGFVGTNTTGSASVSFEFHVIPWHLYKESRDMARRSSHNLTLGGYYAIAESAADALERVVGDSGQPRSSG